MRISDWSSDVCSSDLLSQLVQEVALVLALVARAQQAPVPVVPVDPCVVAGGDALGAQVARGVEEMLELDLAVAQHVRVGRAPGRVLGQDRKSTRLNSSH